MQKGRAAAEAQESSSPLCRSAQRPVPIVPRKDSNNFDLRQEIVQGASLSKFGGFDVKAEQIPETTEHPSPFRNATKTLGAVCCFLWQCRSFVKWRGRMDF